MNKSSLVGWTAVSFQIVSLVLQLSTSLDRFMIINISLMCIALIAFSKAKKDAVVSGDEQ